MQKTRTPPHAYRAVALVLLSVLMILTLSSCGTDALGTKTVTQQFYADSPKDKYGFESSRTFGGASYQLSNEKYKVVRKTETDAKRMTAISGNRTAFTPGKTFTLDGQDYVVQSVGVKKVPVQDQLAVKSDDDAPATLTKTYHDKGSNLHCKLNFQLQTVEKNKSKSWTNAGTFDINLVGYGGKYYDIGTTKLSGKNTLSDIQKKEEQVLEAQGLDSSVNRISEVSWKGKEYKDKVGNRCRDVLVSVQTQSAPLTATYTATMYRFTVNYVPEGAKPEQYLLQGTAVYTPVSHQAGWVRIVLYSLLGVGLIVLLFLARYLWKEHKLLTSGKEIRTIDGIRYTEDDF